MVRLSSHKHDAATNGRLERDTREARPCLSDDTRTLPTVTITATAITATPSLPATGRPVYLDCNATTPLDPEVRDEVLRYLDEDYGNAGSRTHVYGQKAKERVNQARVEVAAVVACQPDEVIFTSGATESNNLALLGLARHGSETGRRHLVSTMIEHKAVLEPLEALRADGFEITLIQPDSGGRVDPEKVVAALRPDTLAVSVMAVNNETGVIQPLHEIAAILAGNNAYLHVDAAQGFGKTIELLRHPRIDLLSISGHKIYGPKGVGALITRRRGYKRARLQPLFFGGGQERGLRPGTLPVPLIAGLGTAARVALRDHGKRAHQCAAFKADMLDALAALRPQLNGDPGHTVPHTVNLSISGLDAEAAILAAKDLIAISNGSACTSQHYEASHVLTAMGLPEARLRGALRISWCHLTRNPDWAAVLAQLARVRGPDN
jgi:cysteine desulfurase